MEGTGSTTAATGGDEHLVRSVTVLARVGSCVSPSFSPDGHSLAFVSSLTGTPQVWIVATEGGWPRQVTALDDPVASVAWSPAGEWLAFQLAPGGGMNSQVYVVRPDGTDLRRVTAGGLTNNWLGPWTRDGQALALASSQRDPSAMDAYLWDVATDHLRLVVRNEGTGIVADVSADNRRMLVVRTPQRGMETLVVVDVASGAEVELSARGEPATIVQAAFSPDGDTVYIGTNQGREMIAFGRISFDAQGQPGPLVMLAERADAELDDFDLTEDGTVAALLWNVAGRSELAFYDVAAGQTAPGPRLPAEVALGTSFSRAGQRLALTLTGAAAPRDIWVLDRQQSSLEQVTHSSHPGVRLADLVQPELLTFPAHDGLALSGWLYRPRGASGPGPLVLDFHGGPEGQTRPSFSYAYQALLAQGIAVFAPNVRGSSGFGKTFINLDNGALRVNAVRDIAACARYVVEAGVAAAGHLGIMGGSYGGYMAMAGLTEFPDLFAAGVDEFGIVNFETFFAQTEPWMAAVSKVEYGDPETQADLLRDLSPIHRLDRVTAPTLVLHGANDTNVPVVEAEQVVETLRRQGVPVEYVLFPDEGHGFVREPNRIRTALAITRWFKTYL